MPAMTSTEATDVELLARAAAGERAAFSQFVKRHEAGVFRYVRALAPSDADAEDALQQTFLAAWRGASDVHPSGTSARPWLLTVARHAVFRLARRHAGEPHPRDTSPVEDAEALGMRAGFGDETSPEDHAARLEQRALLRRALSMLGAEDREVILLRDGSGLSGVEAAAVLGITLEAEKSRIHRARLRLAAALREVR
jgi:RNA polymerase sigma-70 factor, ECF subfamily